MGAVVGCKDMNEGNVVCWNRTWSVEIEPTTPFCGVNVISVSFGEPRGSKMNEWMNEWILYFL